METELLLARTNDTVESVYMTDKPKYFGFLSKEESVFVSKYLQKRNVKHTFFGGENNCERVFLGCFPEWMENPDFPINAVTFTYRISDTLRHRDFLGSLMALGLKREAVGDILIENGRAVVFLSRDITDYVLKNLTKVGNVGVNATVGYTLPLPERDVRTENTTTVASLRLDCIVSSVANCSRNTACELIVGGLVSVNSQVCEKPTKTVTDGDVLSIRHKGKFEIISSTNKSKKDRIILVYKSY